jgi:hypothetical protein
MGGGRLVTRRLRVLPTEGGGVRLEVDDGSGPLVAELPPRAARALVLRLVSILGPVRTVEAELGGQVATVRRPEPRQATPPRRPTPAQVRGAVRAQGRSRRLR